MATTLFKNVRVLDSTGEKPYAGDVLIEGNRIARVERNLNIITGDNHRIVEGDGMTLMSGLCDAHTHFSWIDQPSLDAIGMLPVEEHTLEAMRSAATYLDMGYTMCMGAASAKPRLDVVIRNYINAGKIPGPRYYAASTEIATIGGLGDLNPCHVAAYTFVDVINGPMEMRRSVRKFLKEGVDNIKLNLSGENITGMEAERTPMADDEVHEAVTEARRKPGTRICAHARSNESVLQCLKYGIDFIYHASYVTDETIEKLAAARDKHFVGPGVAWLYQTVYNASDWGVTPEVALAMDYPRELEACIAGVKKMKAAGVRIVPGGDYGFAWTPHGTYAKDLEYFVDLFGFTPMEAIISATALGGDVMKMGHELGQVKDGFLADLILVDGDPLVDITILQDRNRIAAVMKDGQFHRELDPSQRRTLAMTG
ncbi:amidohydrolase family protein [Sphingobium sp. SA2]|uniref:metal-dependent hydrolase family protein n=1 Tax=Sphingobium sp. SA2 TaxID=1524832 RepID=UPI0028C0F30D|nr:amidohydrolase family protein [Sphingobium sp. SA2]MDT7532025.1 amidohydrolase family protein [Sphingobium sp. SA2]